MTKVSNRYRGLSRVGSLSRRAPVRARCPGCPAAAGACRPAVVGLGAGLLLRDRGWRDVGLDAGGRVQAGVDDDRDPQVPTDVLGQHGGDDLAEPCLDDVLGELVRDRDQRGVADHAVQPTEPDERALLGGDGVLEDTESPFPDLGRLALGPGVHGPEVLGWRAVQLGRGGTGLVGHALVPPGCAGRTVFSSSHAGTRRLAMAVHTVVHSLCIKVAPVCPALDTPRWTDNGTHQDATGWGRARDPRDTNEAHGSTSKRLSTTRRTIFRRGTSGRPACRHRPDGLTWDDGRSTDPGPAGRLRLTASRARPYRCPVELPTAAVACPHRAGSPRDHPRATRHRPWHPLCGAAHDRPPVREPTSEQAHVPAQQPSSGQDPRLPPADAHPGRPRDPRCPAHQGSHEALGLTDVLPAAARLRRRRTSPTPCAPLARREADGLRRPARGARRPHHERRFRCAGGLRRPPGSRPGRDPQPGPTPLAPPGPGPAGPASRGHPAGGPGAPGGLGRHLGPAGPQRWTGPWTGPGGVPS